VTTLNQDVTRQWASRQGAVEKGGDMVGEEQVVVTRKSDNREL